ncbi:MAG: arylformamidase [Candidatus Paceibacteria bacterium]|jgi:arylformamidase
MAGLIDITPLISERIGVWPGDTPYSYRFNLRIAEGGNIDLGEMHGTVHLGAHVDAPSHYSGEGQTMEQRSIDRYFGLCEVIEVNVERGERILPTHLCHEPTAERVLFKTGTYPDPESFNEDFAALSAELLEWLSDRGVRLVGIDTPSADLFSDKGLESHNVLFKRDLAILEGIVLDHVEPGQYTLIALPLKLEGADASPVRAALLPLDPTAEES